VAEYRLTGRKGKLEECTMAYQFPRLTLEAYQSELDSLMRLVSLDTDGDDEKVNLIVFTPNNFHLNLSPAELLRRGFIYEAYDAAKQNYSAVYRKDPRALGQSPKILNKKNKKSR
jgi:hypothetical protein